MSSLEPTPRYITGQAMTSIIEKFHWRLDDWMQDWPLEISEEIDLRFCLQEYSQLVDDDEKFLLMKGILYALDTTVGKDFERFVKKTVKLLKDDFDLHKFTIHYWTLYNTDFEDGFRITPLMRDIWNSHMN